MIRLLPRLRAFARSLTRVADQADDLVQATCLRGLDRIDQFAEGTRLDSWLFRIMRNLWIDEFRRAKPVVSLTDTPAAEEIPGLDGREVTLDRLVLAEVGAAVANMPEEQRSVLVLVCVEGMKYREVAEILGIPIGTVMSRLARARQAIAGIADDDTVPAGAGRVRS